MKAVIFAGGVGTRMWPVSRARAPKQFEPLIGNKSTIQFEWRVFVDCFGLDNLLVCTSQRYVEILNKQLPDLAAEQIIIEPARRDLGPAVGYAAAVLNTIAPNEPMAILWSDDIIKKARVFKRIVGYIDGYLKKDPNKMIYLGQKPSFVDQNKGWIHKGTLVGSYDGAGIYKFLGWHYCPPLELARKYFESGEYAINTGFFFTTPRFLMSLYKRYAPLMHKKLLVLADSWGLKKHREILLTVFPGLEKISFDDLIAERTEPNQALVVVADVGWYGFGDWQAIKAALQENGAQVISRGKVFDRNSTDTLVYNYTNQLVTTIDLHGMLVVVTKDAVLVCPDKSVPEIKKMLKGFEKTELEKYL